MIKFDTVGDYGTSVNSRGAELRPVGGYMIASEDRDYKMQTKEAIWWIIKTVGHFLAGC
jgi:hypothetical protein